MKNLTGALRHYECHIHRHAVRAGATVLYLSRLAVRGSRRPAPRTNAEQVYGSVRAARQSVDGLRLRVSPIKCSPVSRSTSWLQALSRSPSQQLVSPSRTEFR
jgi:hypothetical protein